MLYTLDNRIFVSLRQGVMGEAPLDDAGVMYSVYFIVYRKPVSMHPVTNATIKALTCL